ncbi:FlgD immunoglobulin-like domain containing protein, partial [Candidatus Poribacteria bacterium]
LEDAGRAYSVGFSPDGSLLASAGYAEIVGESGVELYDGIKLWDINTGQVIRTIKGLRQGKCISFSPDGEFLASGETGEEGYVRLWNSNTGQVIRKLEGQIGEISSVSFSPDGNLLASGALLGREIKLWNPHTGQEVRTLGQGLLEAVYVTSVSFSPDGNTLASGGWMPGISLWDVNTGQEIRRIAGHMGEIYSVCFSPDGKLLASGSRDDTVKLWDPDTGDLIRTFEGHTANVNSVCFSPDGHLLATGSWDGTVLLWDMIPYMPSEPPRVVAVSITEGQEIFPNATITVTFGQEMETANINVTGATGTTTVAGRTATWTPTGYMPQGGHTLTVDGTDIDGQGVVGFTPINFAALAPDTTVPKIVDDKCDPKNGATDVDISDPPREIAIVFSEVMSEARVIAVDPELDFSEKMSGDTLTLTSWYMSKETEYTITLSGNDLSGNDLATTQYSFTTMSKGRNVELVGSYDIPARIITVAGNYAYVAEDGLHIIDVSVPSSPSEVGFHPTPEQLWMDFTSVTVVGSYAYAVGPIGKAGSELHIVDVSTPSSPSSVGSCQTDGFSWDITIVDNYAYIADGPGLSVVDVSIPSSPSNVGFCETSPGTCGNCNYDVAVVGDYAYITVGGWTGLPPTEENWEGGFSIVDVSTPSAPFEVAFYQTPGKTHGIAVLGNYAHIAGDFGFRTIDVSIPSAPSEAGYYQTDGSSEIIMLNNYACIIGRSGLHIIDVSTPSAPSEVGYYETSGGSGVEVSDGLIYVIDGNGMSILRYTGDVATSIEPFGKLPTVWGGVKTHLYQNYPNPFNPETWMPFQLAEASEVTIRVYNQLGQLVRTLPLGHRQAGIYLERSRAGHWDGRNDAGDHVASGVYFYKLETDDLSQIRKMSVLR